MSRGYFGIGIYHPRHQENVGTLWRSAQAMGAAFIFTVGNRYRRQASDTGHAALHIPMFEYESLEEFEECKPYNCMTICVEQAATARQLPNFVHHPRAAYLLGSEHEGLPKHYADKHVIVEIPQIGAEGSGMRCLNVAVAGSIVMYDRMVKGA